MCTQVQPILILLAVVEKWYGRRQANTYSNMPFQCPLNLEALANMSLKCPLKAFQLEGPSGGIFTWRLKLPNNGKAT